MRTRIGGEVLYDSTLTDLGRHIATIETNGVDGSAAISELTTGTADYQLVVTGSGSYQLPQVTINGATVAWSYPASTGGGGGVSRVNTFIILWVV